MASRGGSAPGGRRGSGAWPRAADFPAEAQFRESGSEDGPPAPGCKGILTPGDAEKEAVLILPVSCRFLQTVV